MVKSGTRLKFISGLTYAIRCRMIETVKFVAGVIFGLAVVIGGIIVLNFLRNQPQSD